MDEHDAITRLKRGDVSGLEMLVRRHQVKAVRTAYLITQDQALAEDLVQTAFLRIVDRIGQFDSQRPFEPWLMRIIANDAVKMMTRGKRHLSLDDENTTGERLAELLPHPSPGPADVAEADELRQFIWEAMEKLSPEQRAAVVLRYYLDYSEREMADELHIPKGTVKWRLHAARAQLRGLLRPLVGKNNGWQEGEV